MRGRDTARETLRKKDGPRWCKRGEGRGRVKRSHFRSKNPSSHLQLSQRPLHNQLTEEVGPADIYVQLLASSDVTQARSVAPSSALVCTETASNTALRHVDNLLTFHHNLRHIHCITFDLILFFFLSAIKYKRKENEAKCNDTVKTSQLTSQVW